MKRLILFRHSEATPYQGNDAQRVLTSYGRELLYHSEAAIKKLVDDDERVIIVSSPYARAMESAHIIKEFFNQDEVVESSALLDGYFEDFLKQCDRLQHDVIIAVGHQPTLSELVYFLTGAHVPFEVASCAGIIMDNIPHLEYIINNDTLMLLSKAK